MSSLKEQLALLVRFRETELPKFLRFSWLFFFLSMVLGFGLWVAMPEAAGKLLSAFYESAVESGAVDQTTDSIALFPLLSSNWTAMLCTVVMGFIPFLLLPALTLLSNGVLMGVLAGVYCTTEGLGLGLFLAGILPHGIFEIPALLFSGACGLALCRTSSRSLLGRPDRLLVPLIEDLLRVLLLMVAPLTVIAALVECYVTPLILSLF